MSLKGFGSASKERHINGSMTSLCLIGGVDCGEGLSPDLKVLGGTLLKKKLCVQGNTELANLALKGDLLVCGNSRIKENLIVDASILAEDLGVLSDILICGNGRVKGDFVIDGNLEVLGDISGNGGGGDIPSNLIVETLTSDIVTANSLIVNDSMTVNGDGQIMGDLEVCGNITGKMDMSLDGEMMVNGEMTVNGEMMVNEKMTVEGDIIGNGDLCIDGDGKFTGDLYVGGNVMAPFVNIQGNCILSNDTDAMVCVYDGGAVDINSTNLNINGPTNINGNTTINDNLTVDEKITANSICANILSITDESVLCGYVLMKGNLDVLGETSLNNILTNSLDVLNDSTLCGDVLIKGNLDILGNMSLGKDIDMLCNDISNVQAIYVDQMFGKNSPINVEDTLFIKNTTEGGNIWFEGGIEIGDTTTSGTTTSSVVIGKGISGTGNETIVIGDSASSFYNNSVSLGSGSTVLGLRGVAIGQGVSTQASSVAINSSCATTQSVTIGTSASVTGIRGTSIGISCSGAGDSVAIGRIATAGIRSVAIGNNVTVSGGLGVCIGDESSSSGSTSIGVRTIASGTTSVAIGNNTTSSGIRSISIGRIAVSDSSESVVIGHLASASAISRAIVLGASAIPSDTAHSFALTCNSASVTPGVFGLTLNGNDSQIAQYGSIYETTTTSGTDIFLLSSSGQLQRFTGSTPQTVILPAVVSLSNGFTFSVANESSADITLFSTRRTTINSSGLLPTDPITVLSTTGFSPSGTILINGGSGWQTVTYTGIVLNTFTGTSGGTGAISIGDEVRQVISTVKTVTPGTQTDIVCVDITATTSLDGWFVSTNTFIETATSNLDMNFFSINNIDSINGNTLNVVDDSVLCGNVLIKGNLQVQGVTIMDGADMFCGNVSNVQAIFVDQMFGKNSANVTVNSDLIVDGNIFANNLGLTVEDEGNIVNTVNSTSSINFVGSGVSATSTGTDSVQVSIVDNAAVLDSAASPTYPEDLTDGVWFGLNTKANSAGPTCVTMGQNASTAYSDSVAIGNSAFGRFRSVAIGSSASTSSYDTIAIGRNSTASGTWCVALGVGALSSGTPGSVAIGVGSQANGSNAVAVGNQARATTGQATAIGGNDGVTLCTASAVHATAIGNGVFAGATSATALGHHSQATGTRSIAIGNQIGSGAGTLTEATQTSGIAIGTIARSLSTDSLCIGRSTLATAADTICIGRSSAASSTGSIALGQGITANQTNGFFVKHRGPLDDSSANLAVFVSGTNELIESTVSGDDLVAIVDGVLDMNCANIANVQAIFVDQMFGKNSPINVEDTLIIQDNGGDSAQIRFSSGIEIGDASTLASSSNSIAIGKGATMIGTNQVVIGDGANTTSFSTRDAVVVGASASARGVNSVVMGTNAIGTDSYVVSVGTGASAGAFSCAVGHGAQANNVVVLAVGTSASCSGGTNSIAVGPSASSTSRNVTAVGDRAGGSAMNATAIGRFSRSSATNAVSLGAYTSAIGTGAVALGASGGLGGRGGIGTRSLTVGFQGRSNGLHSIAIGAYSDSVATSSIAIGGRADSITVGSICIGGYSQTGTGSNQLVVGYNAGNANNTGSDNAIIGSSTLNASSTFTGTIISGSGVLTMDTNAVGTFLIGMTIKGNLVNSGTIILALLSGTLGIAGSTYSISSSSNNTTTTITAYSIASRTTSLGNGTGPNVLGNDNTLLGYNAGSGITVGDNNICIGSGSDVGSNEVSGGISIGKNAIVGNTNVIAIGRLSTASSSGSIALGQGITANQTNGFFVKHRGPLDDSSANLAVFVSGTNELIESTVSGDDLVAIVDGVLDMNCANIGNVQAIFVDQMFGKNSPINVEDTLIIQDNGGDSAQIRFASGIEIGDSAGTASTTDSTGIAIGTTAFSGASDGIAIGRRARANAANSISIGHNTITDNAANANGIKIGYNNGLGGVGEIMIGVSNDTQGLYNSNHVMIGADNFVFNSTGGPILIGRTNTAATGASNSIAIGSNCTTSGNGLTGSGDGIAIGTSVTANGTGVAIGRSANAASRFTVSIGSNSSATAAGLNNGGATSLGYISTSIGDNTSALGARTTASANNASALGASSSATGTSSTAVGVSASTTLTNGTALGSGATTLDTSHSLGFGCNSSSVTQSTLGITLNGEAKQMELYTSIYDSTATSSTVVILASTDSHHHYFTGSVVQTVLLSPADTYNEGFSYRLVNRTTTQQLSVNSSRTTTLALIQLTLPQSILWVNSTSDFDASGTIYVGTDPVTYTGKLEVSPTTISIASGLPAATLNVVSTVGFASSGSILVQSTSGFQVISYTSINATQFLGCTGGVGTANIGFSVNQTSFIGCSGGSGLKTIGTVISQIISEIISINPIFEADVTCIDTTAADGVEGWYTSSSGIDVVLDTAPSGSPGSEKYPTDLSKGVWFGLNTKANAFNSTTITLGNNANTGAATSIAVGESALSRQVDSIVIGRSASSATSGGIGGCVVIGAGANSSLEVDGAVVIGEGAHSSGEQGVAIGSGASVSGNFVGSGIAIGKDALCSARSTAIGFDATSSGTGSLALGESATAANGALFDAISIGRFSMATANRAVSIGGGVVNSVANSVLLGSNGDGYVRFEVPANVTQATSLTTTVVSNAAQGKITLFTPSLAAGAKTKFTVTNSRVQSSSVIIVTVVGEGSTVGLPCQVGTTSISAGSFDVIVYNPDSGATLAAPIIHYHVLYPA